MSAGARLFTGMLLMACLLGSGCASMTPKEQAGKSLVTVAVTVKSVMQGWAKWVTIQKANPAADQAQLLRNEGKVSAAYEQYKAAARIARSLYKEVATDPLASQAELDSAIKATHEAYAKLATTVSTLSK